MSIIADGREISHPMSPKDRAELLGLVGEYRRKNAGAIDLARYFADFTAARAEIDAIQGEMVALTQRLARAAQRMDDMRDGLTADIVGRNKK